MLAILIYQREMVPLSAKVSVLDLVRKTKKDVRRGWNKSICEIMEGKEIHISCAVISQTVKLWLQCVISV